MIAQIVMIALLALSAGLNVAEHGKEKTGTNNAWSSIIAVTIMVAVLWWGGFWSVFST